VHQDAIENPGAFFGTARLLARLEAAGERWTFGLDPACLATYLGRRGLSLVEDVAAYYGAASATMRGYEFYRIARAAVARCP
jgi:hypothetical protein